MESLSPFLNTEVTTAVLNISEKIELYDNGFINLYEFILTISTVILSCPSAEPFYRAIKLLLK